MLTRKPVATRGGEPDPGLWLVLSGSGMKLYAFLGALLALVESGVRFRGVSGTSGGAVVAALLGKHWDPEHPVDAVKAMIDEAKGINPGKELARSFRWRIWEWMLTKVFRTGPRGAFDSAALLKRFRQQLPATIGECKLPIQVTAYQVNLKHGGTKRVLFSAKDTDLPLAVMASMSLPPPLFDPVMYGKAMLQDGGWARNLPLPDEPDLLALYFGNIGDGGVEDVDIVEDPERLATIRDNVDVLLRLLSGQIDMNMRDSLRQAKEGGLNVRRVRLSTTLDVFDFIVSDADIERTIDDGYKSAKIALSTET